MEVTEAARDYLTDRLADSDLDGGCFRIVADSNRTYSLEEGAQEPTDVVIDHAGRTILAYANDLEDRLDGWVLDVEGLPGEDRQLLMMPAQDFPSA